MILSVLVTCKANDSSIRKHIDDKIQKYEWIDRYSKDHVNIDPEGSLYIPLTEAVKMLYKHFQLTCTRPEFVDAKIVKIKKEDRKQ
jgi:hypothetical protein